MQTKVADRQLATPPGGPGGSVTLTEVEIDFGSMPISSKSFTIADALVTGPTKKIVAYPSPTQATGRIGNDWEFDMAFFSCQAGTGDFKLNVVSPYKMAGKRVIYYQII